MPNVFRGLFADPLKARSDLNDKQVEKRMRARVDFSLAAHD